MRPDLKSPEEFMRDASLTDPGAAGGARRGVRACALPYARRRVVSRHARAACPTLSSGPCAQTRTRLAKLELMLRYINDGTGKQQSQPNEQTLDWLQAQHLQLTSLESVRALPALVPPATACSERTAARQLRCPITPTGTIRPIIRLFPPRRPAQELVARGSAEGSPESSSLAMVRTLLQQVEETKEKLEAQPTGTSTNQLAVPGAATAQSGRRPRISDSMRATMNMFEGGDKASPAMLSPERRDTLP